MNTPHTQGPWHVEHPYGEAGTYISSPDTTLVAKVYNELDAKLLAAAPAMLEALYLLASQPSTIFDGSNAARGDIARAAIAKATKH